MAQRTEYIKDVEIIVTLNLKVTLTKLSNYNTINIESCIEEFKEKIESHLTEKIVDDYGQETDVIFGADYVYYNVEKL